MQSHDIPPFGYLAFMLLGLVGQLREKTLASKKRGISTYLIGGILILIIIVGILIYIYVVPSPAPGTTTTPGS